LMDFMSGGSVEQRLILTRPQMYTFFGRMDDKTRLDNLRLNVQVMVDSSSAIQHLHSQNVIHRDIASRNFLMTSTNRAVVADFGLARKLLRNATEYQCPAKELLPIKWCAPETLASHIQSKKTDVYSFGIFLYEVVARCEPFSDAGMTSMNDVAAGICNTTTPLRPEIPGYCPVEVAALMRDCWEFDPSQRPPIETVNIRLQRYLTTLQESNNINNVYVPVNSACDPKPSAITVQHAYMDIYNFYTVVTPMKPASGNPFQAHGNYDRVTDTGHTQMVPMID